MAATHPEILFAQRSSDSDETKNVLFVTINVPELQEDSYTLEYLNDGKKLKFEGTPRAIKSTGTASAIDSKKYAFDLDLFGPVKELRRHLTGKSLFVVLAKTELATDYWPRLTKDKVRTGFIKTDFSRWKDEDEQDEEETTEDDYSSMGGGPPGGGFGGAGMPGMGGPGGAGMPDFASMLGGMGGAGGPDGSPGGSLDFEKMMADMKARGLGGDEDADEEEEEDDDDDDGPPPLEEAPSK